jgi:hypothetical protein
VENGCRSMMMVYIKRAKAPTTDPRVVVDSSITAHSSRGEDCRAQRACRAATVYMIDGAAHS